MAKRNSSKTSDTAKRNRASKNWHVIQRGKKWAVVAEGVRQKARVFNTQGEAINSARKVAKESEGQLVIHAKSGRIRERDSYGRDPFPPKPRKVLHPTGPPRTADRNTIGKAITQADRGSAHR